MSSAAAGAGDAIRRLRAAADGGDAQVALCLCLDGTGVTQEVEAVRYYRMAADQGNADGQYNLGLCFQAGAGVAKDEVEAVRY
jgi:uncharacterized protein